MGTMDMARRLSAMLVECVKENPGKKRGFYVDKLKDVAEIIRGDLTWPSIDELFDKAFQFGRKSVVLTYRDGAWYTTTTPICPHCKQVWLKPKTPDSETTRGIAHHT